LKGSNSKVRLQRLLAEAGVASRRASERIILAGRVTVNGQVVCGLGTQVDPARDKVAVDGRSVRRRRKLYLALNKPAGYVCTCRDPQLRPVAGSLLPAQWRHLYPVGRLDRDTEGLLLLTNDGELSLRLTHPRYGVRKRYLATVPGRVEPPVLARLTQGVRHQGEQLRAQRARLIAAKASHSLVEVELAEGKNHEVRRLFAAQGLRLARLQRTQIGPLKLGALPLGKWRVLSQAEVAALGVKREA
jgi:pseudouridine synthase